MDPEAFLDIANQVIKLKMFPYFDIAHCVLCALSVREDLGSETLLKSMQNIISYKHQIANETESAIVSISENINLQISSTLSSTNREEFRQLMEKFLYLSNNFEENIKIIQDSPKQDIFTNIAKNQWFKWVANFRRLEKIIGSVEEYHNIFKAMSQETEGAQTFSRKHPLACWLSYILVVFAGGMVCNGLLGEPILAPLKNTPQLVIATLVWYVIFYMPFDIGYKVAKFLPIKIVCSAMKEIYRCKKVYDGVTHAGKIYPNAYIIMILIGTLKGNGAGFTKLFERLIRGVWTPTAMEFMQPSFYTKASLVASIIFVLDKKTDLISAPHALVYFGIVIFFVYFKLSSILLGIHDPFVPFENLACALFFGGIWDSLAKILGRGQPKEETKDVKKNN